MKKIVSFLFLSFLIGLPLHANELPNAIICDMETVYTTSGLGSPSETVTFDASCTSDADSPEEWVREGEDFRHVRYEGMSYKWLFPKDVKVGSTFIEEQNPSVEFITPGRHLVTLWVKDKDGGSATTSINILVVTQDPPIPNPPGPGLEGNFSPIANAGGPYVAGIYSHIGKELWGKRTNTGEMIPAPESTVQFLASAIDFDELFGNAQYLQYGWNYDDGCEYKELIKSRVDTQGNNVSYPKGSTIFYDGDGDVKVEVKWDEPGWGGGITGQYTYSVSPGNTCRSTGKNPTHIFSEPGTYNVELTVVDKHYPFGEWKNDNTLFLPPGYTQALTTVVVNTIPDAVMIDILPENGRFFPQAKILFGADTFDADTGDAWPSETFGDLNVVLWDFGDGNTSFEKNPVHAYTEPGNYTVSLAVTDEYHVSKVISRSIKIKPLLSPNNEAPTADFALPEGLPDGTWTMRRLAFRSSTYDSDGDSIRIQWDYGDGTMPGRSRYHQYEKPGEYIVTLTASDGYDTTTVKKTIHITSSTNHFAPTPRFVFNSTTVNFKRGVGFINQSYDRKLGSPRTQDGLSFSWDFGDGNTSNEKHPRNKYTEIGTYIVTLTVTDGEYQSVISKPVEIIESKYPQGLPLTAMESEARAVSPR